MSKRRKLVPYLILLVMVVLTTYEVVGLIRGPKTLHERVLASTSSLSVEDRVVSLEKRVANLERVTGVTKTASSGVKKEIFVSLVGGSVSGSEWTKIPGSDFSMDQSLYGNVIDVSWQGWIDNGYGYVRIFDNTNHRVVDGSEVLISSGEKASFYSKTMSIWRGQNQYWIEARSVAGEVKLSSPRLKIVTK